MTLEVLRALPLFCALGKVSIWTNSVIVSSSFRVARYVFRDPKPETRNPKLTSYPPKKELLPPFSSPDIADPAASSARTGRYTDKYILGCRDADPSRGYG